MKEVVAIYHKNCIDGTTAGSVILKAYPQAKLFPLSHGYSSEDLEPILDVLKPETKIYTVDCASGAKELLATGYKVTTLDHHIGIKEEMDKLASENSDYTFIFDNTKSGASLAWSHFFPDEDQPELIKLVEDSDLYNLKFGDDTKNLNAYLYMFVNDPEAVLEIMESDITGVKEKGKLISSYKENEIQSLVKQLSISIRIGEYIVPAYNITTHVSACGNILSDEVGKTVAMFKVDGEMVKLSFRSQEGQYPSSLDLAKALGGSGHVCASGAKIPLKGFIDRIVW